MMIALPCLMPNPLFPSESSARILSPFAPSPYVSNRRVLGSSSINALIPLHPPHLPRTNRTNTNPRSSSTAAARGEKTSSTLLSNTHPPPINRRPLIRIQTRIVHTRSHLCSRRSRGRRSCTTHTALGERRIRAAAHTVADSGVHAKAGHHGIVARHAHAHAHAHAHLRHHLRHHHALMTTGESVVRRAVHHHRLGLGRLLVAHHALSRGGKVRIMSSTHHGHTGRRLHSTRSSGGIVVLASSKEPVRRPAALSSQETATNFAAATKWICHGIPLGRVVLASSECAVRWAAVLSGEKAA